MYVLLLILWVQTRGAFAQTNQSTYSKARVLALKNGQWFDGKGFKKATWYSVRGILSAIRPSEIDSTIDLEDLFILPPFGEAHNHNVEFSDGFPQLSANYLKRGIFYVKNPNNFREGRKQLGAKGWINKDTTIDAVFANGGITGDKGHPYLVVQRNMERGNATEAQGEGDFYHTVLSVRELTDKWPAIMAGHPDFIKTYLLFSEEYKKRKEDPHYIGQRGLDPVLLPHIVEKAHKAGLRVSTHVETAGDFHQAVRAGVDEINHLPGFRGDPMKKGLDSISTWKEVLKIFQIDQADAKEAARKGIVVVTTLSGITAIKSADNRTVADSLFKMNLKTIKAAGVKIALGSDAYRGDSWAEVEYLLTTGLFSNAELLHMLSHTTPATIFPKRRTGAFRNGYEASFLVLRKDPLSNILDAQEIDFALKQGIVLKDIYK